MHERHGTLSSYNDLGKHLSAPLEQALKFAEDLAHTCSKAELVDPEKDRSYTCVCHACSFALHRGTVTMEVTLARTLSNVSMRLSSRLCAHGESGRIAAAGSPCLLQATRNFVGPTLLAAELKVGGESQFSGSHRCLARIPSAPRSRYRCLLRRCRSHSSSRAE